MPRTFACPAEVVPSRQKTLTTNIRECQAARDVREAERQLVLVLARLEDFAARVRDRLDRIDWHGRHDIIRTIVRRVEIDGTQVEVVFRVPAPGGNGAPSSPPEGGQPIGQYCTADTPANPARFTSCSASAASRSWPGCGNRRPIPDARPAGGRDDHPSGRLPVARHRPAARQPPDRHRHHPAGSLEPEGQALALYKELLARWRAAR